MMDYDSSDLEFMERMMHFTPGEVVDCVNQAAE